MKADSIKDIGVNRYIVIISMALIISGCAAPLVKLKPSMTEIPRPHVIKVALYFESFNFTVGSRVVSNIYKAKTREVKNYIRDVFS